MRVGAEVLATKRRSMTSDSEIEFERFVHDVEQRLRRALVARYGPDSGREATVDALAWAWEHRAQLEKVASPVPYLFRVGQSTRRRRLSRVLIERPTSDDPWVEPELASAIAALPDRQRVAVFLVHGAGWSQSEAAEVLGLRPATVQTHVNRALAKLRKVIEGGSR
jgi:RNA polymerase sigma factor (sigma-70 family)